MHGLGDCSLSIHVPEGWVGTWNLTREDKPALVGDQQRVVLVLVRLRRRRWLGNVRVGSVRKGFRHTT